jgi:hypothetical protein
MRKLWILALLCVGADGGSCDSPQATKGPATNCTVINVPSGCPQVYRITDPETGAVIYVATSGSLTLLPNGEVKAVEKPVEKK